jgi:hypothetical protein
MAEGGTPWDQAFSSGRSSPGGRRAVETRELMKESRESGTAILKGVGVAIIGWGQ